MDDDLRDVPSIDDDSVNDEFAPPIDPDPAVPPEKEPFGGQPVPERDEPGPYGLDLESTEPVDADDTD